MTNSFEDATVSIENLLANESSEAQSVQKVQFNVEVTTINKEKTNQPIVVAQNKEKEVDEEDEAKLQAEALFKNMKAEAEADGNVLGEGDTLFCLDEENVDDLAKEHYNKQIEILKTEKLEHDEEMNEEINQLKSLLAATQLEAEKAKQQKELMVRPLSRERRDPFIQPVTLNGVRSKLLVCNFFPEKGRIGVSFKRYGNQFFIVDITKGTQVDEYKGIGPGLLLYQCISAVPGSSEGINISVSHSEELARAVLAEFGKGRQIQMSFLILPENIPVENIHQQVLKPHVERYRPRSRHRYH